MKRKLQHAVQHREITHCWQPSTDLAKKSTLGVGKTTDYFFQPESLRDLHDIRNLAEDQNKTLIVIGGGSNVVFTDKVEQYVLVELCKSAFTGRTLKKDGDEFLIRTGAGASLPPLVRKAVKEGWFTFGRLTGIPGTVGGAVHGNSGTRLGEIGDFVERVFVLHPDHPEKKLITSPDFTYRSSSLTDEVILEVEFSGTNIEGDNKAPPHERLHEKRSETQPISERSAGCMFKNPDDDSAGRLIDEAGLKGFEVGDARVSSDHANFIVNKGDATSRDVLELIGKVQERVHVEYDVRLEPEVRII